GPPRAVAAGSPDREHDGPDTDGGTRPGAQPLPQGAGPPFLPGQVSARSHLAAHGAGHRATGRSADVSAAPATGVRRPARRAEWVRLPARGGPSPVPSSRESRPVAAAGRAVVRLPADRGAGERRRAPGASAAGVAPDAGAAAAALPRG